jgi:hypothetical protein
MPRRDEDAEAHLTAVNEPAADPARALTLQLLEWLDRQPRAYAEVMDAWRTTCPRLAIWEDACADGLIDCDQSRERIVTPSKKGRELLQASGSTAIKRVR